MLGVTGIVLLSKRVRFYFSLLHFITFGSSTLRAELLFQIWWEPILQRQKAAAYISFDVILLFPALKELCPHPLKFRHVDSGFA